MLKGRWIRKRRRGRGTLSPAGDPGQAKGGSQAKDRMPIEFSKGRVPIEFRKVGCRLSFKR